MYGHPYNILLTCSSTLFTIRERMKYEFSLAHLTILSCSPPDVIEIASDAGYDYVSLRPIAVTPNEPKYPFGEDQNLLRQTRNALPATGMRLLDIEVARRVPEVDCETRMPALDAAVKLGDSH